MNPESSLKSPQANLLLLRDLLLRQRPPLDIGLVNSASDSEIDEAERAIGLRFPNELKELLRASNGQRTLPNGQWYYHDAEQFIPTMRYQSLGYSDAAPDHATATGWLESASHIAGQTQLFRERLQEGLIEEAFECYGPATWHGDYLIFIYNENSDTLALDLNPAAAGVSGQVVSIDTEGYTLCVIAESLNSFLELLVDGFSKGRFVREPDSVWMEEGM